MRSHGVKSGPGTTLINSPLPTPAPGERKRKQEKTEIDSDIYSESFMEVMIGCSGLSMRNGVG